MSMNVDVYDLGTVDEPVPRKRRTAPRRRAPVGRPVELVPDGIRPARVEPIGRDLPRPALTGSLSLFVPGSGQMLMGQFGRGLLILCAIGLSVSVCWAVLSSLDRLVPALELLSLPSGLVLWSLCTFYALAAASHVAGVIHAQRLGVERFTPTLPHPVATGLASLIVPGWGQLINGRRMKAAIFLLSAWTIGALWLLVWSPLPGLLSASGLSLPGSFGQTGAGLLLAILSAGLWAYAAQDGAAGAARNRRI